MTKKSSITKYSAPPTKLHDKKYFYKYVSASTALIILENNSLRWSHPSLFNDSFELQIGTIPSCNSIELSRAMKRQAAVKFRQCLNETADKKFPIGHFIDAKYTWPKFLNVCQGLVNEIELKFQYYSKGYVETLAEIYRDIRILCIAEHYDNMLMWAHYADSHRGAVLRFSVQNSEEADDPFVMAQKVQYSDQPLQLTNADEIVASILSTNDIPLQHYFPTHCYVKHDVWKYEDEWRLIDFCNNACNDSQHNDMKFNTNKLSAIYFGCKSEGEFQEKAKGIIQQKYEHMEVYLSQMSSSSYELIFSRI